MTITVPETPSPDLSAVSTEIGSIRADPLGVRDDLMVRSDTGNVTLGIADDLGLDITAETNGSFDSNLPVTDSRTTGSRFTGRLNGGGHRLRAISDLGDISLRSIAHRNRT